MDEHEFPEKKVDLNSELGMSRRDLLRRGAIVGGTLLWVAPAIQTMAPKAMAAVQGPSKGKCTACFCYDVLGDATRPGLGFTDGEPGVNAGPTSKFFSSDNCENFCKWQGIWAGGANGASDALGHPFTHYQYCAAPDYNPAAGKECVVSNVSGITNCPGGVVVSG